MLRKDFREWKVKQTEMNKLKERVATDLKEREGAGETKESDAETERVKLGKPRKVMQRQRGSNL